MHNQNRGFTTIELVIFLAIISLLIAIIVPNAIQARKYSRKHTCVANLKQISDAKMEWALKEKKTISDTPLPIDLYGGPIARIPNEPRCPSGGIYTIGSMVNPPTCSLEKTLGHIY